MAVQRIRVHITDEHIKKARRDDWRRNPVALALRDAGFAFVRTGTGWAGVSKSSRELRNTWACGTIELPLKVARLLSNYSRMRVNKDKERVRGPKPKLKPTSFVVELTPLVAQAFNVRHLVNREISTQAAA